MIVSRKKIPKLIQIIKKERKGNNNNKNQTKTNQNKTNKIWEYVLHPVLFKVLIVASSHVTSGR